MKETREKIVKRDSLSTNLLRFLSLAFDDDKKKNKRLRKESSFLFLFNPCFPVNFNASVLFDPRCLSISCCFRWWSPEAGPNCRRLPTTLVVDVEV